MNEDQKEAVAQSWPWARRWAPIAGAVIVLAIGSAVAFDRPAPQGSYTLVQRDGVTMPRDGNPLDAELIHCRGLPANDDDPACAAAWEASRREFFGEPAVFDGAATPLPSFRVTAARTAPVQTPSAPGAPAETGER